MKTLEDIIMKMDQLDSLMYSIETAMLDAAPADAGEKVIRLHNLIYLLWEPVFASTGRHRRTERPYRGV